MIGFKLDEKGDILIENNQIQMVSGDELIKQTVQSVIGTNKGEWFFNEDEGINYAKSVGKRLTNFNRQVLHRSYNSVSQGQCVWYTQGRAYEKTL